MSIGAIGATAGGMAPMAPMGDLTPAQIRADRELQAEEWALWRYSVASWRGQRAREAERRQLADLTEVIAVLARALL